MFESFLKPFPWLVCVRSRSASGFAVWHSLAIRRNNSRRSGRAGSRLPRSFSAEQDVG